MHGTVFPPSKPDVLRRLLDDVIGGADAVLLADSAEARALLDQAAADLAERRTRALRVRANRPGGLSVTELLAQLGGRTADSQDDRDLQHSFRALTVLDPACDRIALLVSDAHALQPGALRYIQLACRSTEHLRLVFAGAPGLFELLDDPTFADLAARLERPPLALAAPIVALPIPGSPAPRPTVPSPARPVPLVSPVLQSALASPIAAPAPSAPRPATISLEPIGAEAAPTRPPRPALSARAGRRTAAALGMIGLLLLGMVIGRHAGPTTPASDAGAPTPASDPAVPSAPMPAPSEAASPPPISSPAALAPAALAPAAQTPAAQTPAAQTPAALAPTAPPPAAPPPAAEPPPLPLPASSAPEPETPTEPSPAQPPAAQSLPAQALPAQPLPPQPLPPQPSPTQPSPAAQPQPPPVPAQVHQVATPVPVPPLPPLLEAGPRAKPPRQTARREPPHTLARTARLGPSPREDSGWTDYYGRSATLPEPPLRYSPEPSEGWEQPDRRAYIGTFRPGPGGVRAFSYGE